MKKNYLLKCSRCGKGPKKFFESYTAALGFARNSKWSVIKGEFVCDECQTFKEKLNGVRYTRLGITKANFVRLINTDLSITKEYANMYTGSRPYYGQWFYDNYHDEFDLLFNKWAGGKIREHERLS